MRAALRLLRMVVRDADLDAELRRTCMTRGATVWTNPAQKAVATQGALEFLERTIGR